MLRRPLRGPSPRPGCRSPAWGVLSRFVSDISMLRGFRRVGPPAGGKVPAPIDIDRSVGGTSSEGSDLSMSRSEAQAEVGGASQQARPNSPPPDLILRIRRTPPKGGATFCRDSEHSADVSGLSRNPTPAGGQPDARLRPGGPAYWSFRLMSGRIWRRRTISDR